MRTLKVITPKRAIQAGFTLVEVLIASMIGAIVFAGLFYALNQGTTLIQQDRENLRATQIMNGQIEAIRLCAWGTNGLFNTSVVPTTFTNYFYPSTLGGFASNSMVYFGTISVETNVAFRTVSTNGTVSVTAPPTYSNNLARVTVTLTWSERHYGITNRFSRTNRTYVSANGLYDYLATK